MNSRCLAWRNEPLQPFEPTNPFRADVTRKAPSPLLAEDRLPTNVFPLPELADLRTARCAPEDLRTRRGPRPMPPPAPVSRQATSWIDDYTLDESLAEVDFFIGQHLVDDALDTLEAIVDRFEASSEIEDCIDRLDRSTLDGPAVSNLRF